MLAKTTEKKEGLGNGRTNETGLGQSESFQATSALWHFRSSSILRDSQFLLTPPVAGQSTVQYSTVQYSTVQYSTSQYSTAGQCLLYRHTVQRTNKKRSVEMTNQNDSTRNGQFVELKKKWQFEFKIRVWI